MKPCLGLLRLCARPPLPAQGGPRGEPRVRATHTPMPLPWPAGWARRSVVRKRAFVPFLCIFDSFVANN